MKIDWFTVVAQIINFLILVWLLKKLLYKPVLSVIAKREKNISDRMKAAENKEAEAKMVGEDLQKKNEDLVRHKNELLSKAEDEVNNERKRLEDNVHHEINSLREKLNREMNEDKEKHMGEFVEEMEREIFSITEKVLSDLSDVSIQDRIIEVFIHRIDQMNEEERKNIMGSASISGKVVFIKTPFVLSDFQKRKLEDKIHEEFQGDNQIEFEVNNDLISGIELTIHGYKIGWNVRQYLNSLKEFVGKDVQKVSAQ